MGGNGRKRREKNYRESHGGSTKLPAPPDPSSVDALPSKLRKIMAFTEKKSPVNSAEKGDGAVKKMLHSEGRSNNDTTGIKRKINGDKPAESKLHEKKNKKGKRNKVNDLRFETTEELGGALSKRKERKKQHLEERKKKRKKSRIEDDADFPRHEHIKFGEVVDAPPKFIAIPKTANDVSQERLRLKAVEAYRSRKGWTSRPGIHLPCQ